MIKTQDYMNRAKSKKRKRYHNSSEQKISWDSSEISWEWPSKNSFFDYQGFLYINPAPDDYR